MRLIGLTTIVGGVLGFLLAPFLVMVKYLTGWAIIPEPAWIGMVKPALGALLTFGTPVKLWVVYGVMYTAALVLMFGGVIALVREIKARTGRVQPKSLWIVVVGLCLVIVGDAIHTLTWHQNGLTTPTPGTNPIANTAYAVHMMGMNFVIVGSLATGIIGLRKRILAPWLAWLFLLVTPSAVLMSVTVLPTTPSGALALFSLGMIALGYSFAARKPVLAPHTA